MEDSQKVSDAKKKAQAAVKKRTSKGGISDYQYHIVIGGFILLCAVALGSAFMGDHRKLNQIPVIEDNYILKANAKEDKLYEVGDNEFFGDQKLSEAKLLINNQLSNKPSLYKCSTESDTSIIPSSYDFYQQYPDCKKAVWDQGNCSSAYSIATVSSVADRFCMHTYRSKTQIRPELSPQTVISCDQEKNYQCKGGSVTTVLDYAKRHGFVDTKCFQYAKQGAEDVVCPLKELEECEKYHISDYCLATNIEGIKKEIYKNGPIISIMTAYRDFMIYKKGIYSPEEGMAKFRTGQAVKVYGWGSEDIDGQVVDYWLIENSWGESWGEKGTAKVNLKIDDNQLNFFAIGALPKVEKEEEPVTETKEGEEEDKATTDFEDNEADDIKNEKI